MGTECVLLLAPVTLVEITFAASFAELLELKGRTLWLFVPPAVFALLPLVAVWGLAITFCIRGTQQLATTAPVWWFVATAGAGIPLIGISAWLLDASLGGIFMGASDAFWLGKDDDPFGLRFRAVTAIWALKNAALTAPLLLPLAHLWWERFRGNGGHSLP